MSDSLVSTTSGNANKAERFAELKKNLFKKLDALDKVLNMPSMFVSEHFFSIRTEIDEMTETMLIALDERNGGDPNLADTNDGSEDLTPKMINSIREIMMDELKKYESACLGALKKSNAVPGHLDKGKNSELKKSQENVKKYREGIEKIFEKASGSKLTKDDHEKFESSCESLFNQIDADLTSQKRKVLLGKTVIFKKSYLNQLGILVVLEGDFLTDNEITFIK